MVDIIDWPFKALADSVGNSSDNLKLIFSFLLSYPLAGLLKRVPDAKPQYKNAFTITISAFYLLVLFPLASGAQTLCISAGATYILASFMRTSSYMPWFNFAFLMSHMSVSHIARQVANDTSVLDITGAQMVLVMKLCAFGWNVADGQLDPAELSDLQRERALKDVPPVLHYLGWVFFFPALFGGPAFDFVDYRRWLDCTMFEVPAQIDPAKRPPVRKKRKIPRSGTPAAIKLVIGLLWVALFVILGSRFDKSRLLSDDFLTYGFIHKLFIMYMVPFVARFKYYGVWTLTEGSCILAGLGYNGVDAITGKVSWNRLQNIDPWAVETAQNSRAYLGGWNMNTNAWLRNYVYLRVTPKGKKPGFRASLITFGTSAFWHGFYPGYYLTFIFASLIQTAAKNYRRYIRPFFLASPSANTPAPQKRYYDFITWLATQLTFSFATVPFLLLSFEDSLKAWSRVYFYAIIWTVVSLAIFASPGTKSYLRKELERRSGRATERLVRTTSTESLNGQMPVLGISQKPDEDMNEAMEEIRAEIEAKKRGDKKMHVQKTN